MKEDQALTEYVVDVKDQPLGRMASKIAVMLQGKNMASYDHRKPGDVKVIVKNIKDIKITGKKPEQKIYYHHAGKLGHLKQRKYKDVFSRKPNWVLWHAVRGMLPKNTLRAKRLKNLIFEA
ncbi:MAG: 50S ribosomal protein L13 [Patescibacteria group bacterium]|nr:50S ribosomal protein L13 [Patescibacteria group bacterium]MCL5224406.1 50S ribosomal protein L13 [Patescibacteria group bacterium]